MLISSRYLQGGAPTCCQFCHAPFRTVDGHAEAWRNSAGEYFCSEFCADDADAVGVHLGHIGEDVGAIRSDVGEEGKRLGGDLAELWLASIAAGRADGEADKTPLGELVGEVAIGLVAGQMGHPGMGPASPTGTGHLHGVDQPNQLEGVGVLAGGEPGHQVPTTTVAEGVELGGQPTS